MTADCAAALAASAPIVRVPQGATSATVAANALYRRYSGLVFSLLASVTIHPGSNVESFTVSTTPPAAPTRV